MTPEPTEPPVRLVFVKRKRRVIRIRDLKKVQALLELGLSENSGQSGAEFTLCTPTKSDRAKINGASI